MKVLALALATSLSVGGCTATFDSGTTNIIVKSCTALNVAHLAFLTLMPNASVNMIGKVNLAKAGVDRICANPAAIVDTVSAAQAVLDATDAILEAIRATGGSTA